MTLISTIVKIQEDQGKTHTLFLTAVGGGLNAIVAAAKAQYGKDCIVRPFQGAYLAIWDCHIEDNGLGGDIMVCKNTVMFWAEVKVLPGTPCSVTTQTYDLEGTK